MLPAAHRKGPMERILLATDGSASAAHALEVAVTLAADTGAALDLVTVRPPHIAGRAGSGGPINDVDSQSGAERVLEEAAARVASLGREGTRHALHGDPAEEIALLAGKVGADLIVVGSRGHGGVVGTLMGSVSQSLLKSSPVPVTVVRDAGKAST